MDDVDRAQEINEAHLQQALETRANRNQHRPSRMTCLDCDEPIPEPRRLAIPGCLRCRDCQTLLEHWRPL